MKILTLAVVNLLAGSEVHYATEMADTEMQPTQNWNASISLLHCILLSSCAIHMSGLA